MTNARHACAPRSMAGERAVDDDECPENPMSDPIVAGIMGVIGYVMLAFSLHLAVLAFAQGLPGFAVPCVIAAGVWIRWMRLSWLDSRGELH